MLSKLIGSCIAVLVWAHFGQTRADTMDTPARAAIVIDMTSGAVLLAKDPDSQLPPASMSKLMTLYMVFEALEQRRLTLKSEFRVSETAAAMKGSTSYLRPGSRVQIETLVMGVVVQSGNDAAVAIAEALAGTETAFAEQMNARAQELGLTNSFFVNSTGWPADGHVMSVRDLAQLAIRIIQDFPQYYPYFAEREYTWEGVTQKNRNDLLWLDIGADGLKTGHTKEAGFGLVASAVRGDRRVVVVITGLETDQQRKLEGERLIEWAFRAFESEKLLTAGEELARAQVWIGSEKTVRLGPARDVVLTAPYGAIDQVKGELQYEEPLEAPVQAGMEVGQVVLTVPGLEPITVPLVALDSVGRGGFVARVEAAVELLAGQILPTASGPGQIEAQ